MGPKEEDNGVVLLGAVALICGAIAFVPWLLKVTPAEASKTPTAMAGQTGSKERVRVIVPFTPNTVPSQR